VTPGTRQGRLWSQGNHIGKVAWFMYTRRRPWQNPSVTGFGSYRVRGRGLGKTGRGHGCFGRGFFWMRWAK